MSSKLGVLTAIAEAEAYDREQSGTAPADTSSKLDEVSASSAAALQEQARQVLRDRAAAGLPELSGIRLGKMFERGERWGRDRIAEVRSSGVTFATPAVAATTAPEAADDAAQPNRVEMPTVAADEQGAQTVRAPGMPRSWPVLLLALPAFVSIWAGWVGLGELTGFGPVNLLPGIGDGWVINSAITLPIGVEAYAAYALRVWLSGATRNEQARRFAMWSAIGSLALGMAGQVAYHLMTAAGVTVAPWPITTFVSCLPVVVLGCGAALAHLLHQPRDRGGPDRG